MGVATGSGEMRIHIGFVFLFLGFILVGIQANAERPNFVFILADDCTYRDLGCYGGQAHTPNIDRLATEGMRLTHCFQSAPMCSPTRHNIYTGLYPVRSGAYPNHTFVNPGVKSVVHYLKPLGYRVALSGKRHIGPRKSFPFEYSGKKNPDRKAIDRLIAESKMAETPFCLFACSNEPHSPWDKGDASRYPPNYVKLPPYLADTPTVRTQFSRYLAEITYFDRQVGEILELLKKHNVEKETMVIVASEQGNSFPFAKWTCYGNGLQSAMVVRWPDKVASQSTSDAIVEYTDILPTLIEAAGGQRVESLDGSSLMAVFQGKTNHHRDYTCGLMTTRGIIHGSDAYAIRTIRDRRYRLVWNLHHDSKFQNICMREPAFQSILQAAEGGDPKARWVVENYRSRPELELYDCEADPLEMKNIAGDPTHSETVAKLKNRLESWMREQGDKGKQTEREALLHQNKYRKLTLEEAEVLWRKNKK